MGIVGVICLLHSTRYGSAEREEQGRKQGFAACSHAVINLAAFDRDDTPQGVSLRTTARLWVHSLSVIASLSTLLEPLINPRISSARRPKFRLSSASLFLR